MKNKDSYIPLLILLFIASLSGFWFFAYMTSPDQSEVNSRTTASLSTVQLLKIAKHSKMASSSSDFKNQKVIQKLKNRRPSSVNPWFQDSEKIFYQKQDYLISKNVLALPKNKYQKGRVLKTLDSWVFFEKENPSSKGYKVWLNSNNQELLVATGKIILDLSSKETLQRIQDVYHLELHYQAPGRSSFVLGAPPEQDLLSLYEELKFEEGVEQVELELIGRGVRPR